MAEKETKLKVTKDYLDSNIRINNDISAGRGGHYGGSFFEYKCFKCKSFEPKEKMFDFNGKLICKKCAYCLKPEEKEKLVYLPKKVGNELWKIH